MSERPANVDGPRRATTASDRPAIPGYEILDELGRGGMGVVYKARQENSGRLVALKMIRDGDLAGGQQRDRFRIEAEAVARMRHPNIVSIHEVGEHAGRHYFAMELVEGVGLDKHLAGRAWPAVQAAELIRTLALAAQHAHERRIVHRDLKPANILIEMQNAECRMQNDMPRNADFVPKITDFGLAKRLDTDSTGWTLEGVALGTPAYMAPEQAAGRINEVGPAVDVYALGVILYEALVGRPPFQGETGAATVQRVLNDEPELPTRLRPDVPRDLETVCLKCLEKVAARRYASAADLADDLGRFLENQPIAAVPPDPMERLSRVAARDGYQILGEAGRGPRGTVYLARYGRLKQSLAVKLFVAVDCTREEWETRVRVDTDQWATLTHPQVVPVQRAGWWDGAPYLVREFVPQGTLADKLAGRPWPVGQALGLVEQLAVIVAYLHRQGVVHGNLKPSNVLLAANGIPQLADFRLSGGPLQGSPPRDERTAAALGYLAPELIDRDAEPRPHADVYGLGLILYELLAGRPPFAGIDAREVLERVRSHDPVPPSQFNRDVQPRVDDMCLRCLLKDRWKRYARAFDLASRLRYLQEN